MSTSGRETSNIYIGRGANSSPGTGQATELRVIGDESIIVATGDLVMNESEVSSNSSLITQIKGPAITPIRLSGDADISNGTLRIELDGYAPNAGDKSTLIQAGVELDDDFDAINEMIEAAGYEPVEHAVALELGEIIGPFKSVDHSLARLTPGLDWEVTYTDEEVQLGVIQSGNIPGDFNENGVLDAIDINLLSGQVRQGTNDIAYDLNQDELVNDADRKIWVNDLKFTYFGDSNLDGEFNSSDFVFVFTKVEYEDGIADNSTWESGDWNGDGEFDSADFVTAFQANGFEQGPRAAATAMAPEPASSALLICGLLLCIGFRRR